jgi:hypothetical protein
MKMNDRRLLLLNDYDSQHHITSSSSVRYKREHFFSDIIARRTLDMGRDRSRLVS